MIHALLALLYLAQLLLRSALARRAADRADAATLHAQALGACAVRHDDIAVLQPIRSGDPALAEVLAGALDALPDAAHVLWLVDADDAPALAITAALARARPARRLTRLVLPPPAPDRNPKTVKLEAGVAASGESVLVVLDDDARLSGAALDTLVATLEHAALATALPWYEDARPLPGALLARFVDDHAALTYLAPLALLDPVSINGMAYALRRETLARLGGFVSQAHYLADDLALALALRERGLAIAQTTAPVRMRTTLAGSAHYVRLMHRWHLFATLLLAAHGARLRLLAGVLNGLPPLLLWAVVLWPLGAASGTALAVTLATVLVRAWVVAHLQRRFVPAPLPARPLVSLLAELLQPVHLVHALLVRRIRWRDRHYRVRAVDDFVACR